MRAHVERQWRHSGRWRLSGYYYVGLLQPYRVYDADQCRPTAPGHVAGMGNTLKVGYIEVTQVVRGLPRTTFKEPPEMGTGDRMPIWTGRLCRCVAIRSSIPATSTGRDRDSVRHGARLASRTRPRSRRRCNTATHGH